MATAKTNILINSLSGRLGNVVFYTRPGRADSARIQCVRSYVIPRNPDTEAQRIARRSFGDAVRSWQSLSPDERYSYNRKARYLNMSGYNLYISKYLRRAMQAIAHTPIDKPTSLTWNLKLSTLNLTSGSRACRTLPERIPSVSASSLKAACINMPAQALNPRPG